MTSYFNKGHYNYEDGLDYVVGIKYKVKEYFWFMHKLSDILNVIIQNIIEINEFDEYNLEMANNDSIDSLDKLSVRYILISKKI